MPHPAQAEPSGLGCSCPPMPDSAAANVSAVTSSFSSQSENPGGPTGIQVTIKFIFLAFLLYFFKPRLHLDDGPPVTEQWGRTFIPTAPGPHRVRCYVPYLFYRTMGDSTVDVTVPPGGTVSVEWRSPWLVFMPGRWRVMEQAHGLTGAG